MGIKFHCPNGHKLNVKSFLGGKRAICPACGAKVLVPDVSAAVARAASGGSAADTPRMGQAEPLRQTPGDWDVQGDLAPAQPVESAAQSTYTAANGAATQASSPAGPYAAIAQAPGAVWYVRPPSGGQFGPATGEIMREWIEGGRVVSTALVWRAGWQEWRTASTVFPHLAEASGAPLAPPRPGEAPASAAPAPSRLASAPASSATPVTPLAVQPSAAPADSVLPDIFAEVSARAPAPRGQRRKSKNDASLWATIVLIVIALVLIVVLIVVLNRNPDQKTEEAQARPAAASTPSPTAAPRSG